MLNEGYLTVEIDDLHPFLNRCSKGQARMRSALSNDLLVFGQINFFARLYRGEVSYTIHEIGYRFIVVMRSVNSETVAVVEVTACVRLRVLFELAKDFVSCCLTEIIERSHDVRCDTVAHDSWISVRTLSDPSVGNTYTRKRHRNGFKRSGLLRRNLERVRVIQARVIRRSFDGQWGGRPMGGLLVTIRKICRGCDGHGGLVGVFCIASCFWSWIWIWWPTGGRQQGSVGIQLQGSLERINPSFTNISGAYSVVTADDTSPAFFNSGGARRSFEIIKVDEGRTSLTRKSMYLRILDTQKIAPSQYGRWRSI